jgi:LmbE family N-acetylglucosaminyl deacetylase
MSFRSTLRPVKRWISDLIERVFLLFIGITSQRMRHAVSRWSSPGGQSILIVAPHPDDEAMGCAGTAVLHTLSGDCVQLAIATDGRRSRVLPDPIDVANKRRCEAIDAAAQMKVTHLEWIGLAEGAWGVTTLQAALLGLLDKYRPTVIYAPSLVDFHPEHFKVAHALALALNQWLGTQSCVVRVYQVQVPLTSALTNLYADVSAVQSDWRAALRAYSSQAASVNCSYRMRRYGAQRQRASSHVESFWEMPASRYAWLHREPPESWASSFRGLRFFPLSDPLAYIMGRKARNHLYSVDQHPA